MKVVYFHDVMPSSDTPIIHSDTIFGAVCNAIAEVRGENVLAEALENKKIIVSSAYPFINGERKIHHLIPFELKKLWTGALDKNQKRMYVDISWLWRDEEITDYLFDPPVLLDQARNTIERTSYEATPFITTRINCRDAGMWVAYGGDTKLCEEAFRYLRDEGFCGDRNLGFGAQTRIEFREVDAPKTGTFFVNLSLYRPAEDEFNIIDFSQSRYKLIRRSGWIETDGVGRYTKPAIYYFAECSVFACRSSKPEYGQYEIIKKQGLNNKVWRSGITLPLFLGRKAPWSSLD